MTKVLICGDRNWTDKEKIREYVEILHKKHDDLVIIEGEARGADSLVRDCAKELGVIVEAYPADWNQYGRAAGPIRNQQMLETVPDMVIAFHDDIENSKGTKDMVNRAKKIGIKTLIISHPKP